LFRLGGLDLGEFDSLNIQGDALLSGGTVEFDFLGYTPMAGNSWDFLFADTIGGWENLNFTFDGLSPDLAYAFDFANGVETLSLHSVPGPTTPTSIPEPATMLLLASGLMMIVVLYRNPFARKNS